MRVLLDTHALVWALTDPRRLGPAATALISSRETEIVVSAVSAWEIATKVRIGKLPTAAAIADSYPQHIERLGASALPISAPHALLAGSMRWTHRDPFDRMLAAQALLDGLPLVTVDPVFASVVGVRTRW